jgi:hypothetical protein
MPWDARSFSHHNFALTPDQSAHAARIANAILRRGEPEGLAIATANRMVGHRADGGGLTGQVIQFPGRHAHRDDGGGLTGANLVDPTQGGIGGVAPTATTMSPLARSMVQRYSALPPEKLQELLVQMGNSPQAGIIRSVLRQKQMMPAANQPVPQVGGGAMGAPIQPLPGFGVGMASPGAQPGMADGGHVAHRPFGGVMAPSEASPWWERREAYGADRPMTGFLAGSTLGRADSMKGTSPAGSYVMPADVIAGLGEGNSLAGARIFQDMINTGPHGIPMPRGGGHRGPPAPPRPLPIGQAKGGGVRSSTTPVALSHGEFVVQPHEVLAIGGGDHKRGQDILDQLVMALRKDQIKEAKQLPPPVGMKKAA